MIVTWGSPIHSTLSSGDLLFTYDSSNSLGGALATGSFSLVKLYYEMLYWIKL